MRAIKKYFMEIGVPLHLICDQAQEDVRVYARLICNEAGCHVIELEKGTPAANRAERSIKILKYGLKRNIFDTNSPMVFWCYYIESRASVINGTIRVNHLLEGQPQYFRLMDQPTDISSICQLGWYDWVVYCVEGHTFPLQNQRLGRALGQSNNSGSAMLQWLLTGTGDIVPLQILRQLDERSIPVMIKQMK